MAHHGKTATSCYVKAKTAQILMVSEIAQNLTDPIAEEERKQKRISLSTA